MVLARDAPRALERRLAVRQRHLAHSAVAIAAGHIRDGGATLDEGGRMDGTVLLVRFPDRAALDRHLAADPYMVEGVWAAVTVTPLLCAD